MFSVHAYDTRLLKDDKNTYKKRNVCVSETYF